MVSMVVQVWGSYSPSGCRTFTARGACVQFASSLGEVIGVAVLANTLQTPAVFAFLDTPQVRVDSLSKTAAFGIAHAECSCALDMPEWL